MGDINAKVDSNNTLLEYVIAQHSLGDRNDNDYGLWNSVFSPTSSFAAYHWKSDPISCQDRGISSDAPLSSPWGTAWPKAATGYSRSGYKDSKIISSDTLSISNSAALSLEKNFSEDWIMRSRLSTQWRTTPIARSNSYSDKKISLFWADTHDLIFSCLRLRIAPVSTSWFQRLIPPISIESPSLIRLLRLFDRGKATPLIACQICWAAQWRMLNWIGLPLKARFSLGQINLATIFERSA